MMSILKKGFPHPVKIFEQNRTKKNIYLRKFSFVQLTHFRPVVSFYRNQPIYEVASPNLGLKCVNL